MIRGRVLDPRGQPVAGAAVHVVAAPAAMRDIAQLTGHDGCFDLSVAADGLYKIGARSAGGQTAGAEVHVSGQPCVDVELRFGP